MSNNPDFFFSYASLDWKSGLKNDFKKFFEALEKKLVDHGRTDGGYFAARDVERGALWESEIASKLRRSRVLVPLYSPNYFKSLYCGKEWQAFAERYEENEKMRPSDVKASAVILPIIWNAVPEAEFPASVPAMQFKKGVDPPIYQSRGLGRMMEVTKFGKDYEAFLDRFAFELAQMARDQGAAKVRNMQPWDDLNPAFPANSRNGTKYVRYVFLAGLRDEMTAVRTQTDAYGIYINRQDWRPGYPEGTTTVGDLGVSVANELQKECEILEVNDKLLDRIEEAKKRKNIVVVLVDPWSLKLNDFDDFEKKFDSKEFPNSGVLVALNDKEAETKAELQEFEKSLKIRFVGRRARQEFYKSSVSAVDTEDLRKALREALNAAQGKLVEQGGVRPGESRGGAPGHPILNFSK